MYKAMLFAAAVLSFSCSATSFSHADPLVNAFVAGFNKGKQGGQGDLGGQNDPHQMFQQIMEQLSQGGSASTRPKGVPADTSRSVDQRVPLRQSKT